MEADVNITSGSIYRFCTLSRDNFGASLLNACARELQAKHSTWGCIMRCSWCNGCFILWLLFRLCYPLWFSHVEEGWSGKDESQGGLRGRKHDSHRANGVDDNLEAVFVKTLALVASGNEWEGIVSNYFEKRTKGSERASWQCWMHKRWTSAGVSGMQPSPMSHFCLATHGPFLWSRILDNLAYWAVEEKQE